MNKIPITLKGKTIGYVKGKVFHKTVKASQHFLHYPPSIAFDYTTLADAQVYGAEQVEIRDSESKRIYRADISQIASKGISIDRGHGSQIALLMEEWSISGGETPLITKPPKPPKAPIPPPTKQLSYF